MSGLQGIMREETRNFELTMARFTATSDRPCYVTSILLLLFATGVLAQPSTTSQSRKSKVDIKHVAVNLKLDWSGKPAYSTIDITFVPVERIDTLRLDAVQLTIETITTLDGTSLRYAYNPQHTQENLRIALGRTYQAGEQTTVSIRYRTPCVNGTNPPNMGDISEYDF